MQNIRPIIEQRIREQVPALREVAGAGSLSALLKSGQIVDSGAYVIRERKSAVDMASLDGLYQQIDLSFSVIIVVDNVADEKGADAEDASDALQESIKDALQGWAPTLDFEPMRYAGGELFSFLDGWHVWRERYTTKTFD